MEGLLKITKKNKNAIIPQRATGGSAGLDLCACIDAPVEIAPQQIVAVSTGIAIALPSENYVALVFARSGLGIKHGISLANGVGVIDSDYRGEICVGLCNLSNEPYTIQPNERIAQMVIMPTCPLALQEVDSLDLTARGEGGFGSTGRL